jgi:hypothetical protein
MGSALNLYEWTWFWKVWRSVPFAVISLPAIFQGSKAAKSLILLEFLDRKICPVHSAKRKNPCESMTCKGFCFSGLAAELATIPG